MIYVQSLYVILPPSNTDAVLLTVTVKTTIYYFQNGVG